MRSWTEKHRNHQAAGRTLGREISRFFGQEDAVVLALPGWGVTVARGVVEEIGAPLVVLPAGGGGFLPDVAGRRAFLVDQGLFAVEPMTTAVRSARKSGARKVIVAVPAAAREFKRRLEDDADFVLTHAVDPLDLAARLRPDAPPTKGAGRPYSTSKLDEVFTRRFVS